MHFEGAPKIEVSVRKTSRVLDCCRLIIDWRHLCKTFFFFLFLSTGQAGPGFNNTGPLRAGPKLSRFPIFSSPVYSSQNAKKKQLAVSVVLAAFVRRSRTTVVGLIVNLCNERQQ